MIKDKMSSDYRKIALTGNVYLKYYDEPPEFKKGDLRLYLHNDAISTFTGDYENASYSGYFKAEIYDAKYWHKIDMEEFFENREYKYAKRQVPFSTAILCKEILASFNGVELYRAYRGHFTKHEYIEEERVTKAKRGRK